MAGLRAFPIPTPDCQPISIIHGPDGNLWFTEQNASNVVRVTPNGEITEYTTPTFGPSAGILRRARTGMSGSLKEPWDRLRSLLRAVTSEEIPFSSSGELG